MNKFLGEADGPACVAEVPTVAVIGSGGGFRAMTAYSGVFKALVETGILDCSTYACGLSGSSWFLSTLYSHPRWPDQLDMSEFLDEIMNKMDKKLTRFLNASTLYTFYKIMAEKRKERQPVSFTDIFGRMVGETLIPDRMESTLTAQREKIKEGASPMPLYTCVHVKKDVPARSFQEWVEFSPYEIGMPKYGTFMDSALFGSKFFMGKLVKQYKEQPLHFLQGIWGSAFCILFKRLFEDNSRIDPAEMLREQLQEQLVEDGKNSSSDCSDDDDDDGDDDSAENWSSVDSDASSVAADGQNVHIGEGQDTKDQKSAVIQGPASDEAGQKVARFASGGSSQDLGSDEDTVDNIVDKVDADSAYEGEDDEEEEEEDEDDEMGGEETVKPGILKKVRKGSLEAKLLQKQLKALQNSSRKEGGDMIDGNISSSSKLFSGVNSADADQSESLKKSVNWGACPTRHSDPSKVTEQRRSMYRRAGSSMRKSRSGSKSYWKGLIKGLVESNSWEILSTRQGRAAVIHNFMRGLNLQQTYPISPFTPIDQRVIEGDEFKGNFEMHSTSVKHIYMVDAGLTFNSPYPLVLRPQRQVDIILSFDFSARSSDGHQPFKELLLAEKWAKLNRLPFPPIDTSVFEREGMKELYIFRHPTDPHCPIVFHFPLVNKTFRDFKAPGVPRQTEEECRFANFDIFDDPNAPYSTFNFTYTHESFQRLSQLTEYNTLKHVEDIRQVMKEVVTKKRVGPPRVPIQSKDIKLLRMKSVQEMRKLRKFISRMESRSSFSCSSRSGSARGSLPNTFLPNSPHTLSPGQRNHYDSFSSSQDGSVFSSSPKDKLACFSSASFSTSRDFGNESLGASLPSHIIHRMRQQQQQQQQQQQPDHHQHQHQPGKPIPDPRQSLTPTDSVHGTPPSDQEGLQELRKAQGEDTASSSPRNSLSSQGSVYGTPPKGDNAEWLSFYRGRRLSNINEDSVDSVRSDCDAPPNSQESNSSARKKPRVIHCSAQPLSSVTESTTPSPLQAPSPKSVLSQNAKSRSPSPSPKLKMPTKFVFEDKDAPAPENAGKQSSNGSSGSSGVWSVTSGSGSTTSGSGRFTPANIDLMKKKKRKESPPNPFFKNAFFMRSTLSSGSNSSLGVLDDKPVKFERGKSYRLSPQPLTLDSKNSSNSSVDTPQSNRPTLHGKSPLTQDITLTQSQSSSVYRLQSQTSSNEEFHTAPLAFKADGTPVEDQKLSKMYYESAKNKRKFFRRQSTVSSLNSISLEDKSYKNDSSQVFDGEGSQSVGGGVGGADVEQPMRFRELFLSLEQQSDTGSINNQTNSDTRGSAGEIFHRVTSEESDRYHSVTSNQSDTYFDPELMDLGDFGGGDDVIDRKSSLTDVRTMEMDNVASVKVPIGPSQALQHQVTVENADIWFDAKPCLS
ncbi:phospholipase A2 [Elysia marginata]|uniref:Phospholipase A2 n=1 Tax=Elysia marginata TaxID=1093978 RepID=A0AAV4E891_9GAST|nr:phospholipase A2 [Elysia marginata]